MTETITPSSAGQMAADILDRLQDRSIENRLAVLDEIEVSGSGHYGPAFSAMDLLVTLYYGWLDVRPDDPRWADRDRFVLGKGHACSALYPILADLGYFDRRELTTFCRLGSRLGDHPDMKKVPGIDFSSGSLGHGLSVGVGMALAGQIRSKDYRTVVMLGDGEQNEGQMWEAAALAGSRRLTNLLAIVDVNGVCVDGTTADVLSMEPLEDKWTSFGWTVEHVDGHDHADIQWMLDRFDDRRARGDAAPTVLLARTVVGRGVSFIEGLSEWHVGYLGEVDRLRAADDIRAMFTSEGDRA